MNTNELSTQFWEEGYLHLPRFFSPAIMDKLNDIILNHFGMSPGWEHSNEFIKKSGAEIVPWFPQREGVTEFNEIAECQPLQAITQAILGDGWGELYSMSMFSKKGTKGQAWHQDCPPEDPRRFNLNRLVYTHDINEAVGGQVKLVPGTHKQGELPVGEPFGQMPGEITLAPKKGDLVLLHGHCWHSVSPVVGTYRVSTNYRAMPCDTPEEITDICVYRNMRYQFSTSEVILDRESVI